MAEDWKYFEWYLERYDYISLGVAGSRYFMYLPWLVQCFKIAKELKKKFHGFGITAWEALKAFPWYSIDSSSWNRAGRFGRYIVFDENKGEMQEMYVGKQSNYQYASHLREMGISPFDLMKRSQKSTEIANALSIIGYDRAINWLEERNKRIGYI